MSVELFHGVNENAVESDRMVSQQQTIFQEQLCVKPRMQMEMSMRPNDPPIRAQFPPFLGHRSSLCCRFPTVR